MIAYNEAIWSTIFIVILVYGSRLNVSEIEKFCFFDFSYDYESGVTPDEWGGKERKECYSLSTSRLCRMIAKNDFIVWKNGPQYENDFF